MLHKYITLNEHTTPGTRNATIGSSKHEGMSHSHAAIIAQAERNAAAELNWTRLLALLLLFLHSSGQSTQFCLHHTNFSNKMA
jgi:hypothetical protein